MELITVIKDNFLFEQDDVAESMYIIKSGKISILISDGLITKEVDSLGPGSLIGEMSLFDKKLRSASAKAAADSVLIQLPYSKLDLELETMPAWVKAVLKKLSEKIREANTKILQQTD